MKLFFFSLIIFISASLPSIAHACSCATGDATVEFNNAKAVFVGRMLGGSEKFTARYSDTEAAELEAGSVRFAVQESFKGEVPKEIVLNVDSMRGTSCGDYGLKRGEVYVVYAYASEKDSSLMYTGVCTRTSQVTNKYVEDDLKFLRSLPAAGSGGNLKGRIWIDVKSTTGGSAEPLPNVNVKVTGDDGLVRTVVSDKDGNFELNKLKPGKYRVVPEVHQNYVVDDEPAEVEIADLGTGVVGIEAYFASTVSGRVIDKAGVGYDFGFFHLESTDTTKNVYGHSEGKNGEFLVDGIPPGEYVLFIELNHDKSDGDKKYYYPGTFDRQQAQTVEIGLKTDLTNLAYTLPDAYRVRTIEGRAFWANGRPAKGVEVNLLCATSTRPDGLTVESGPTSIESDAAGRFRLQGFTGTTYQLEARGLMKGKLVNSPSRKIQLTNNISNARVVLGGKGLSGGGCR